MCGICGAVARDPTRPADGDLVARMGRTLAHRGPDGEGLVADGPAALAGRRLAIVDRSLRAAQPMRAHDAPVWVLHNGEIYNHVEERRRLESRGHQFRSDSDTEVVLRLYLEHGAALVERLAGMYAFAIWDGRRRELLLGRDPFGEKPLYYRESASGLAFASEIKALLLAASPSPAIDLEAIHHFLAFDYVPGPRTAFEGIRRLPAGHLLRYRNGAARLERHFEPRFESSTPPPPAEEAAAEIRARLARAVARRLMGEAPIGVFLSGGLDSSALVALYAAQAAAPVRTFSVAFGEPGHDERRWSSLVARRFGADHHEVVVRPELAAELPEIVAHFDEPFGDPSALPTWVLAREARREVTVVLTGEGGDELFAGYERYRLDAIARGWLELPAPLRRGAAAALGPFERARLPPAHPLRRAARLAAFEPATEGERYARWLLHLDEALERRLYSPELAGAARESSTRLLDECLTARGAGLEADPLTRTLAADTAGYLAGDLLVKTDMATMAHGLEARCPFLDLELFRYAAALPSTYKLRRRRTKWILRRAFRDLLPREVLRRPKRGFGLPLDAWLGGELRPLLHEMVLSARAAARGYFREGALRRLVEDHERGVQPAPFLLWNLLVLELWHRAREERGVAG